MMWAMFEASAALALHTTVSVSLYNKGAGKETLKRGIIDSSTILLCLLFA